MSSARSLVLMGCLLAVTMAVACGAENRSPIGEPAGDASAAGNADAAKVNEGDGAAEPDDAAAPDGASTTFHVGGFVTGLTGVGLVLSIGNEDVVVAAANGAIVPFTFPTALAGGASYAVSVKFQPTGPVQSCAVTGGNGVVAGRDINDIEVACETVAYAVGGNVLGLEGSGLVLKNTAQGAADLLPITPVVGDAGAPAVSFRFNKKVESGASFVVTVATQPSQPTQNCVLSGDQGTVVAGEVTTVTVSCNTNSYTVGGTVEGLSGSGLVLKLGATGPEIAVNTLEFSFPSVLKSGTGYSVLVAANPTGPWQTCDVSQGSGVIGGANVTDVHVKCSTNPYSVGGAVSGLAGTGLKLKNGVDEISVASPGGTFTFPTKVESGQGYALSVTGQPTSPWQSCDVTGTGSGVVQGGDVKDLAVSCNTSSFKVAANVTGPVGTGLKLKSGTDEVSVASASSSVPFPTLVASGQTYGVTISSPPLGAICSIAGGTGTMQGADVSVPVSCSVGTVAGGSSTTSSQPVPPNTLLARRVTLPVGLKVASLGGYWSNSSCSVKYALYSDSAGAPGALVASTGVVITTGSGPSEALLASATNVTAGDYWIGLVLQTACNGYFAPTGGTGYVANALPFANGFPVTFGVASPGGTGLDLAMFLRGAP